VEEAAMSQQESTAADRSQRRRVSRLDRLGKRALLSMGRRIGHGRIALKDIEGEDVIGQGGGLAAEVTVHRPRFYRRALFGGNIGVAEAYMDGDWSCSDLVALLRIFARDANLVDAFGGWKRLATPAHRLIHWLRLNTKGNSRRNIAGHYDLGNDFFSLFLDESLTYSCAIFERDDASLAEAQTAKLDRLCRKLRLKPSDHVLEIGTGWGSFALHAAQNYGCRVTTATLSKEQRELAAQRVEEAGLADCVEVVLKDYRDLAGTYDKLASIEMIEAVGGQYFDAFFAQCGRLLRKDGLFGIQAITMSDYRHDKSKKGVDFIKRYIFPGGCLPSVTAMCQSAAKVSDLKLVHLEDITPHYARTLREWRRRFMARLDDVARQGFPETFQRMWEFYLSYCEAGFSERIIGDVQAVFAKPGNRDAPILPALSS
jgi:cyclopropane-fatty-acyl-phospholipid synthase